MLLITGGAGGVGSILIQVARRLIGLTIVATRDAAGIAKTASRFSALMPSSILPVKRAWRRAHRLSQTFVQNGGHAEPVIGRAFARPVGFAHPIYP